MRVRFKENSYNSAKILLFEATHSWARERPTAQEGVETLSDARIMVEFRRISPSKFQSSGLLNL